MTQTSTAKTVTIKDPKAPASLAQTSFLNSLVAERDLPETCQKVQLAMTLGILTKGNASAFISELLAAPKKAAAPAPVITTLTEPVAQVVAEAAALTEAPAFGYYQLNGSLYHWDVTGKDSKPTLRKLAVVTHYDGTKKGSWKKAYGNAPGTKPVKLAVTFTPYNGKGHQKAPVTLPVWIPGIIAAAALEGIKPLTQDEAAALGKAYTFCIRCGAQLTDPVSVANGIGPVCATYWA
jgi:hypothetical protein